MPEKEDLWWRWKNKYIFINYTIRRHVYVTGIGIGIYFNPGINTEIHAKAFKNMYFLEFGRRQNKGV